MVGYEDIKLLAVYTGVRPYYADCNKRSHLGPCCSVVELPPRVFVTSVLPSLMDFQQWKLYQFSPKLLATLPPLALNAPHVPRSYHPHQIISIPKATAFITLTIFSWGMLSLRHISSRISETNIATFYSLTHLYNPKILLTSQETHSNPTPLYYGDGLLPLSSVKFDTIFITIHSQEAHVYLPIRSLSYESYGKYELYRDSKLQRKDSLSSTAQHQIISGHGFSCRTYRAFS